MASSAKTSSTAANVDRDSGPAWSNLSNALTDNSNYGEISLTTANSISDWAVFTNWGFSISPLATIEGILFTYKAKTPTWTDEVTVDELRLYDNGVTNAYPAYQSDTTWDTTLTTYTAGSPSDTWGVGIIGSPGITLDAATINSSNFGVAMSVEAGSVYGASTFEGQIFYVSMTIYHTINGFRSGSTEVKDVRIGNTQVTRGYLGGTPLNTDEITIL
jgi:hypothetical protein